MAGLRGVRILDKSSFWTSGFQTSTVFSSLLLNYFRSCLKLFQISQLIRHNQSLEKDLDAMDIKIGLLVKNMIDLVLFA